MRRDNVIRYTGFDVYIYISIRDYDRFNREREREVRFLLGKNGFIGIPFNVFTRMSGMVYTGNKHWKYR